MPTRHLSDVHAIAGRLIELAERSKADFARAVGEQGLTAQQARALFFLEEPRRMRELACHLACDASNVTGIADRLVDQGLVERVPGEDRRVVMLRLTDAGRGARERAADQVVAAPLPAQRLTRSEQRELVALLDKMLGEESPRA